MAIGRPITFDPDSALDAAMRQFWRTGYEATSMQDLLKAMHLSKSSLYQTFGSKQELFQRCLARYIGSFSEELGVQLASAQNGKVFIKGIFDLVLSEALCDEKNGCLLVNTANEMGQRDGHIARLVGEGTVKLCKIIEMAVSAGQKQGVITRNKDAKTLADYLVVNIFGLRTMVKGGADKKSLLKMTEITLSVLD